MFDADPTSEGTFGQIISYMHDPDGIDWVAMSFLEFFKESNDNLENWLEDPEALAENLGFF